MVAVSMAALRVVEDAHFDVTEARFTALEKLVEVQSVQIVVVEREAQLEQRDLSNLLDTVRAEMSILEDKVLMFPTFPSLLY